MNRYFINLLKLLDSSFGPILLKIPIKRKITDPKLDNILVIRPGGIGDAALLLPVLKKLKKKHSVKIDVLCEPRNKAVFSRALYVDRVFDYWSIRDLSLLLRKKYKLIIDTEQSHILSNFFSYLLMAEKRAGFFTNNRSYDIGTYYSHTDYELNSFNRLFSVAIDKWDKRLDFDPPYIYTSCAEKQKVSSIIQDIKRPIVCLFAGASISLRKWSPIRWAKVSDRLWDMGFQCVLLGSKLDSDINRKIASYCSSEIRDLTGLLSISETAELFRKSRLLISTDSGILHIAVIEGLSTVSLFGPGIADKWAPKGSKHKVIRKELPCSPCTRFGSTPYCKKKALCMRLIKVEDVMEAVCELLNHLLDNVY